MTLRSFRGVPVRKFKTFYLPKKTCDFRGVPVKKNTLYITEKAAAAAAAGFEVHNSALSP